MTLSWSAPSSDGGSAITGYRVYRATAAGGPFGLIATLGSSTLTYRDTGLAPGATYWYRVTATNAVGESAPAETSVQLPSPQPPGAPESPAAAPGPGVGQITVSWQPPSSDGGSPVSAYRVYRAESAAGPFVAVATTDAAARSWTDSGLPNGATRYYRLTATNAVGEGPASVAVSATTFDLPTAPTNLLAAAGPGRGELSLSWQFPSSDGGSPLSSFRVYRAEAPAGPYSLAATVPPSTVTYRDSGLPNGATRYYRLTATNAVGEGPASATASATTFDVPGPPQSLAAAAGPGIGEVSLSWLTPASNGGTPVTAYRVWRAAPGGPYELLAETTAESFRDSGLPNGATRSYRVTALNLAGEGPPAEATATTFDAPGPPQAVGASAGPSAGDLTVSWQPPASDGGKAISAYRLWRAETAGGPYQLVATVGGNARSYRDRGLGDGVTRFYRVSAVNAVGEGPLSDEASGRTFTSPSAPRDLRASPGLGLREIDLAWQPPSDNGGTPLTGYLVYRATRPGGPYLLVGIAAPNNPRFTDSGLQPLQTYYYVVGAQNLVGPSPASNEACSKPSPWVALPGMGLCELTVP